MGGVHVGNDDEVVITFCEHGRYFDVLISVQSAVDLVAALSRAIVETAASNPPNVKWLEQPQMVRSSEVSFDVETIGEGEIGIAMKLPGLLPLTVEIPSGSARLLAYAILEAADESDHDTKGPSASRSKSGLAG